MLTFQCYPHSVGVPCLAFSWLADEGITVGCEGDIGSTMLVYVMQNLAQSASTYMEPVAIDEDKNTMINTRDPLHHQANRDESAEEDDKNTTRELE